MELEGISADAVKDGAEPSGISSGIKS